MNLYIKNMVCPRCISAIKDILQELDIEFVHIQLGLVITTNNLTKGHIQILEDKLKSVGFDLLNDSQKQLVEQIKNIIINQIYDSTDKSFVISELLSNELNKDYSFLSKLFSSIEGVTIEQYTILQKVERIKELLSYDQLTLSEIADSMGYSSVAHISAQFKKVTGMTPSQFKIQSSNLRNSIDSI